MAVGTRVRELLADKDVVKLLVQVQLPEGDAIKLPLRVQVPGVETDGVWLVVGLTLQLLEEGVLLVVLVDEELSVAEWAASKH